MFLKITCFCAVLVNFAFSELVLPPEVQELTKKIHATCTAKSGITDDAVKNYVITNNAPEMMCYMKCFMMEANWMKEDGSIPHEDILNETHFDLKELVSGLLEKCRDVSEGTHECEKAYNFNKCVQKLIPEDYHLP